MARAHWPIMGVKSPADGAEIITAIQRDFPEMGRGAQFYGETTKAGKAPSWTVSLFCEKTEADFMTGWVVGYLRHAQLVERMHPTEILDLCDLLLEEHEAKAALALERAQRRAARQGKTLVIEGEFEPVADDARARVVELEAELAELQAARSHRPARPQQVGPPRTLRERLRAPAEHVPRQLGQGDRAPIFEDEDDDQGDDGDDDEDNEGG